VRENERDFLAQKHSTGSVEATEGMYGIDADGECNAGGGLSGDIRFTGRLHGLPLSVPVSKVMSYTYVNPVVAVLLGVLLLHERPEPNEYAGMATIVIAVFLMTTAKVGAKA